MATWSLYAPPTIDRAGRETRVYLAEIRGAISYSSAEEAASEGISYAAETAYALIPHRYAPPGGFRRGMLLSGEGAEYRMLTPIRHGRLWSVKCIRLHL